MQQQWRWPDPLAQTVRPFHGAHFDVPDPLYQAIMAFRTDLVPDTAQCLNYFDLLVPPITSWDPTSASGVALHERLLELRSGVPTCPTLAA